MAGAWCLVLFFMGPLFPSRPSPRDPGGGGPLSTGACDRGASLMDSSISSPIPVREAIEKKTQQDFGVKTVSKKTEGKFQVFRLRNDS